MPERRQPIFQNETKRKDRICQGRKKVRAVRGTNDDP
jgi:hypothetical protein